MNFTLRVTLRSAWMFVGALALLFSGCHGSKNVPKGVKVVHNAAELLQAIRPNATIRLMPGDYNLSRETSITTNYLRWEEVYDGQEATLSNIANLTLIGEPGARILAEPRYAWIFNFQNSANITLKNITFGHTEAGNCVGGVLQFERCAKVAIDNCHLYGSGTEGIHLTAVASFVMSNSEIYECTYDLLTLEASADILFKNTTFRETGEFTLITCKDTDKLRFEDCTFTDNFTGDYIPYFFGMEENKTDVVLTRCTFKNNRVQQFADFPEHIRRVDCTFTDNKFKDFTDQQLSKDH